MSCSHAASSGACRIVRVSTTVSVMPYRYRNQRHGPPARRCGRGRRARRHPGTAAARGRQRCRPPAPRQSWPRWAPCPSPGDEDAFKRVPRVWHSRLVARRVRRPAAGLQLVRRDWCAVGTTGAARDARHHADAVAELPEGDLPERLRVQRTLELLRPNGRAGEGVRRRAAREQLGRLCGRRQVPRRFQLPRHVHLLRGVSAHATPTRRPQTIASTSHV
eukprot:scaffold22147_cov120-Isochrysis_galbana.AAC.2